MGKNDLVIAPLESDRERAATFLDEFGLDRAGGFFTDKAGHPLSISTRWTDGLERYASAELGRAGRTIAKPDEIWLLWKRGADDKPMLTRRYFATIGGVDIAADVNRAGWCFATSEDPGFDLDQVRHGELIWTASSQA